jgi:hypothetical protein
MSDWFDMTAVAVFQFASATRSYSCLAAPQENTTRNEYSHINPIYLVIYFEENTALILQMKSRMC